jgi:hypothetical protein
VRSPAWDCPLVASKHGVPFGVLGSLTGLLSCLLFSAAAAQEAVAQEEDESSLQTHGFVSQGFIKTTDNNYLAQSERGSFEFTEVGINFTKVLGDKLRVGMQLFAHDLGPLGNLTPTFDWFYLDYRFEDWFGIRAGRTKLPFGLYNENNDIDAARVPILLPQSVYPVANREFLLAQTGLELYGNVPLGMAGDAEYRIYGGTIFLDTSNSTTELSKFDVPYLVGGRLMWLPPLTGLQLGGSVQALRLDFDFVPSAEQLTQYEEQDILPPDFSGTVSTRIPATLWVASAEYQSGDLLLATEFGQTYYDIESNLLLPRTRAKTQGFHAMASYRMASWFTPGVYYSALFPDDGNREGHSAYQHDVAVTTRYDLTPNWLLKLESHYMHGTAALSPAINGGASRATLDADWVLLLAKTTAYF